MRSAPKQARLPRPPEATARVSAARLARPHGHIEKIYAGMVTKGPLPGVPWRACPVEQGRGETLHQDQVLGLREPLHQARRHYMRRYGYRGVVPGNSPEITRGHDSYGFADLKYAMCFVCTPASHRPYVRRRAPDLRPGDAHGGPVPHGEYVGGRWRPHQRAYYAGHLVGSGCATRPPRPRARPFQMRIFGPAAASEIFTERGVLRRGCASATARARTCLAIQ